MLRLKLAFRPEDGPQHGWDPGGGLSGWSPGMEGRSGTLEACVGWVDQAESNLTFDEAEGAAVWLVVFLRNEACKSLKSNHGRRTPTSTCGQDQRSKGTMLHFKDTLFVCSPLLAFMSSVASISGGCTIRWCGSWRFWYQRRLIVCFCPRNFGPWCWVLRFPQMLPIISWRTVVRHM